MMRWLGIALLGLAAGCRPVPTPSTIVAQPVPPSAPLPGSARPPRLNAAKVRENDPDWIYAQREIYANQAELAQRLTALDKEAVQRYVLARGDATKKTVTLTFDDGPHPQGTLPLLQILKEENVPATFFVVGFMAEKYPDLVRQIAAAGHEVGNHSYSHATLSRLTQDQVLVDLKANNDVIKRFTGKHARYCRPPGGDLDTAVLSAAAAENLTTVLWTDDPGDYANIDDDLLLSRELAQLKNGAIILLHDGTVNTQQTLRTFIRAARAKGFEFVTLDEFMRDTKGTVPR